MNLRLFLFLIFALSVSTYAQTGPAVPVEMNKLNFLAGKWQGEGWIIMGPGARRTFRQTENVQSKVDGTVLLIDGLGKGKIDNKGEEVTIHNAFAVISYDKEAKVYRWRAFKGDGTSFDVQPLVADRSLVWGFKDPRAGDIRFTITLNAKGQWVETGEMSRDGKTWMQFFEMTLDRVSQ